MVDVILSYAALILKAAFLAEQIVDAIVLVFIAAAMMSSFTYTLGVIGAEWPYNKTKMYTRGIVARLAT